MKEGNMMNYPHVSLKSTERIKKIDVTCPGVDIKRLMLDCLDKMGKITGNTKMSLNKLGEYYPEFKNFVVKIDRKGLPLENQCNNLKALSEALYGDVTSLPSWNDVLKYRKDYNLKYSAKYPHVDFYFLNILNSNNAIPVDEKIGLLYHMECLGKKLNKTITYKEYLLHYNLKWKSHEGDIGNIKSGKKHHIPDTVRMLQDLYHEDTPNKDRSAMNITKNLEKHSPHPSVGDKLTKEEAEVKQNKGTRELFSSKIKQLETSLTEKSKELKGLYEELNRKRAVNEALTEDNGKLEKNNVTLAKQIKSLNKSVMNLSYQLEKAESDRDNANKALDALVSKLTIQGKLNPKEASMTNKELKDEVLKRSKIAVSHLLGKLKGRK